MAATRQKIDDILQSRFHPEKLVVIDESDEHVGHAGAMDGKGHFAIEIASAAFSNQSRIQSHRMIYDALGSLMQTEIHALRIVIGNTPHSSPTNTHVPPVLTPPVHDNKQKLIFCLLVLIGIMSQFSSDNFLPSLPYIAADLHTTGAIAKLSIGLYFMGLCVSTLIYGPLSDFYGRRKVLLSGYAIFIVGCAVITMADSITQLLLGRVIQACGIGAGAALFRVIMRDVFEGKTLAKVGSYLGMVFAIVPPLAPISGGYIQESIGWRGNFTLLLILSVILALLIASMLPETLHAIHRRSRTIKEVISVYLDLITNRHFLGYAGCSSLAFANIMVYITISPFLFQHTLKLSPVEFGWLAPLGTLSYLMGAMLNVKLLNYYSSPELLRSASFQMTLASLIMLTLGLCGLLNVYVIILPWMLMTCANGLVFSNAFACAFDHFPEAAGIAGALFTSVQTLTAATFSALAALVPTHNQIGLAMTLLGINLALVFLICVVLGVRKN